MRCVVKGCESKSTGPDKVSFFRFPKENSHEWIANLRPFAPGVINADNDRVCEKHFEKESIRIVHGRKILNVNVNPTLFELSLLRYSKSEKKENNSSPSLEKSLNGSVNRPPTAKFRSRRLCVTNSKREEVLVEEVPTKTEAPKKSTSSVKYDYAEESAPSSVAKYESQEESAPAATIANRIFTSTPKAIQLTSSLKRNNSSGDTNERPVKNAKFPVVYALTPSSTGGLTGAQQLTPITRPVTLTKIQNITTMSGSENKTFSGTGVKLVPGTVIKLAGNKKFTIPMIGANGNFNTGVARRPTIYIKAPVKKTIRTVTEELIAKSPKLHVGMSAERLTILKNVAFQKAKIPFVDLLITLKKLRLNESFALLAEYFEYPESEVEKIFSRTVIKLAKYLKFLIRWPDGEKYCERHKNLPITFRSKLSYVQSLIECVETEIRPEACPTLDTIDCKFFKFILAITPAGVISYVSEAFVGNHDDLAIFNACNFQNLIPKYLSLVADPGQALANHRSEFETDSTTDSADETEEHSIKDVKMRRFTSTGATTAANKLNACAQRASNNLNIVNSQLTSSKVKDFSIPTLRVREPACRQQIRDIIYTLREFKILQPYAILEPHLYQYINEILVIVSALTNFQR